MAVFRIRKAQSDLVAHVVPVEPHVFEMSKLIPSRHLLTIPRALFTEHPEESYQK